MQVIDKLVTIIQPNVKDSSRPRYAIGKDGNVVNHQRKPYARYVVENINHPGGKPIRFKSIEAAERYMESRQ